MGRANRGVLTGDGRGCCVLIGCANRGGEGLLCANRGCANRGGAAVC